jgi:hypothetical protein
MDLREYEHLKFALAAVLQQIPSPETHERRERLRELFSRLAEDRFNLVVVGRFSRGKTSLMNAVLATDRLPTGIRPLTSVITTVAYGPKEQAVIHYLGFGTPEDIQLARLPEYITENGNSGNRRRVRVAEVQLPAEILRRRFSGAASTSWTRRGSARRSSPTRAPPRNSCRRPTLSCW